MASKPNQPRFYKRWAFWCVVVIAMPSVLTVIVLLSGANRYAEKLAELRAQDRPTNLKELVAAYYVLPDGTPSATDQWVAAIQSLDQASIEAVVDVLPYIGNPDAAKPGDDWAELQAAQKFVAEQAGTYQLIREAIATEGAIQFDAPFSINAATSSIQQVQDLRQLTRLLCLDSAVAFEGQDYDRVYKNTLGIFSMVNACRFEVTFLGQLTRCALANTALDQVSLYASHCDWNDAQLLSLQKAIALPDYRQAYTRAAFAQQAFGLEVMDASMPYATIGNAPQLMLIKSIERQTNSVKGPWHQAIAVHMEIEADLNSRSGLIDQIRLHPLRLTSITSLSIINSFAGSAARQRCAIAGLAAERQSRSEGQFAETLDQVSDEYFPEKSDSQRLTDPFSGKPLKFVATGQLVQVYSVGKNQQDDSGRLEMEGDSPDWDIGFQIRKKPMNSADDRQ